MAKKKEIVFEKQEEKEIAETIDKEEVEDVIKESEKINEIIKEDSTRDSLVDDIAESLGEDSSTQEEAIAKITTKLTKDDPRTIKLLSELSPQEIVLFAVCKTKYKEFGNTMGDGLLDDLLRLKISKRREGRKEIIKVAGAIREQEMRKGVLARLGISRLRQQ